MMTMKKAKTRDEDFRKVAGNLAGVYHGREEGFNTMGLDPNGWTHKLRDAGVPLATAIEWVRDATAAGQRCNCPLPKEHMVWAKFEEWLASV